MVAVVVEKTRARGGRGSGREQSPVYTIQSRFILIQIVSGLSSVYTAHKIATTLVSCKPMQPCIASITNYKSCIHCFPLLFWASIVYRVHTSYGSFSHLYTCNQD